ncbi:hypothetical protein K488DRAFT_85675 [Vararia minispora EC-137]|uniref:Uncharacterized protein n=1 Tax=Vararia minispora EC-137 TaxID=1314806 RepID=A0ACB8QLP4_9AGAM|nr:hypothetical protein K488DRAFT_85675 [Vararia minispora EC-137]
MPEDQLKRSITQALDLLREANGEGADLDMDDDSYTAMFAALFPDLLDSGSLLATDAEAVLDQAPEPPVSVPIFCVGSSDHNRVSSGIQMQCFENVEGTGIPALQTWLEYIARKDRLQIASNAFDQVMLAVQSLSDLLRLKNRVPNQPSSDFKVRWASGEADKDLPAGGKGGEARLGRPEDYKQVADAGFRARILFESAKVTTTCFNKLRDDIDGLISRACDQGQTNAATRSALQSAIRPAVTETLKWQRFRAILNGKRPKDRDYGIWYNRDRSFSVDIPGNLFKPLHAKLAEPLNDHYSDDFLTSLTRDITSAFKRVIDEVFDSVSDADFRAAIPSGNPPPAN